MDFLPKKIADYAEEHTTADNPILQELIRQTHLKTLKPRMLSGHLQGRFLSMISQLMQPKRILEIGTFTGYATLCLAEGLDTEGVLTTIEADDEKENFIKSFIEKAGLAPKIDLRIGNALDIIPTLNDTFDLVFIDAGKRDYAQYYDLVLSKVRSGGLIIADNILWSGKVTDEKKDLDSQILDDFNKKIHADPQVECVLLPLRDGLMMARKK
jgi:caffeoyl-CoA O-methyltransferase